MSSPRTINAVLDRAVERWPNQPAVVTDTATATYAEIHDRVLRLAGGLAATGIEPGDRLAACLPNTIDIVVAFYATARVGALWVGINRQLAAPEKAQILADTTPRILVAQADTLASLAARAPIPGLEGVAVDGGGRWAELCAGVPRDHDAVEPAAPAAIAFTSGTSGMPKGVIHSHHNLVLPGEVLAATRGYDTSFRRGDYLSLTILNMVVLSTLTAAQVGGTSVLHDGANVADLGAWIGRHRVTVFNAVPTTLYGLVRSEAIDRRDLASLNDVMTGGAPCPEELRERFLDRFGRPVHSAYGLTEAPTVVTIDPPGDPSPEGRSGRPLPHLDVTFAPTSGEQTGGQILVGPATSGRWAGAWRPFLGYWNRPGVEVPVVDGRLHTGDIGRFDDGRLVVMGRLGSLIIRGGANVYPAEVERVLRELPGVADAVVVGLPDERLGETVNALIELEAGQTTTERTLIEGCATELARYKVPARILVVDTIERNAMGKPDLRAARARLASDT